MIPLFEDVTYMHEAPPSWKKFIGLLDDLDAERYFAEGKINVKTVEENFGIVTIRYGNVVSVYFVDEHAKAYYELMTA